MIKASGNISSFNLGLLLIVLRECLKLIHHIMVYALPYGLLEEIRSIYGYRIPTSYKLEVRHLRESMF